MTDYSTSTQVKTSNSEDEVNTLLNSDWVLLSVCNSQGRPVFVLGLPYTFDLERYGDTAKSLSEAV